MYQGINSLSKDGRGFITSLYVS